MIEYGEEPSEAETYEVCVAVMIPVKRIVRVTANSEFDARELAKQMVKVQARQGVDSDWSIPTKSRSSVGSDHDLLGPMVRIHHENIVNSPQIISGMCPKILDEEPWIRIGGEWVTADVAGNLLR